MNNKPKPDGDSTCGAVGLVVAAGVEHAVAIDVGGSFELDLYEGQIVAADFDGF